MTDIRNPKLIYLKGFLFLVILVMSLALVFQETRSWKVVGLLVLTVWSSARLYYFMFYVVENYVDSEYKFSGVISLLIYLIKKREK